MTKEKLYRLMDVLDEIKQVDEIISIHESKGKSTLMLNQYRSKKEKLLVYFINELNASSDHRPYRLKLIRQVMEQFYNTPSTKEIKIDSSLDQLEKAILA